MKGISFISGEEEEKPSRRRQRDDIEYTSGQRLDAPDQFQAPPRGKAKATPSPMASPIKEKTPSRFALWRAKRRAEQEAERQAKEAEKMHAGAPVPTTPANDLLHAEAVAEPKKAVPKPRPPVVPAMPTPPAPAAPVMPPAVSPTPELGIHAAPAHHKEGISTDLLSGVEPDAGEHLAPTHQREAIGADLLHGQPGHNPMPAPVSEKKPTQKKTKRKKRRAEKEEPEVRLDVNLVPHDEQEEHKPMNRLHTLGYLAVLQVILVLTAFGVMRWYGAQLEADIARTEQQILNVQTDIAGFSDLRREADQVNERLTGVDEVLQAHVYWTPLLEQLERYTLPTVFYRSMNGSAISGEFAFDVVARDYGQVEPQVRLFKQSPAVTDVSVTSAIQFPASEVVTLEEGQELPPEIAALFEENEDGEVTNPLEDETLVSFSMNIDFDPEIFRFPRRESLQTEQE